PRAAFLVVVVPPVDDEQLGDVAAVRGLGVAEGAPADEQPDPIAGAEALDEPLPARVPARDRDAGSAGFLGVVEPVDAEVEVASVLRRLLERLSDPLEAVLRLLVPLVGGLLVPQLCLSEILLDAAALLVAVTEVDLGAGQTLLGRLANPFDRQRVIL